MSDKLDAKYMPITDKYLCSDFIEGYNNNTIEKMLSTIKTLSDENRANWKYYEKNNTKSHIHYAEYTACAEVDVILRWVEDWLISLKKEIIHNETKDIINNDTTLAKISSLIDKKNDYIMKLENKLIQIKNDYNKLGR